jgi:hypothetical protein
MPAHIGHMLEGPESGLDRLDSVSVRVDDLVKDRRPPKAAALRAVLDKIINTNNWQPSDQGRHPIRRIDPEQHIALPRRSARLNLRVRRWA